MSKEQISPSPARVEGLTAELLPCPFCGNKAVTYPSPDANRNIISCRLGHAPMRTVEGWNTRADSTKAKIEKLGAALKRAIKEGRHGFACDKARCVCWKTAARAALVESPKENQ